jgi:hypothetical protein
MNRGFALGLALGFLAAGLVGEVGRVTTVTHAQPTPPTPPPGQSIRLGPPEFPSALPMSPQLPPPAPRETLEPPLNLAGAVVARPAANPAATRTIPELLQRLDKLKQQKIDLERESKETVELIQKRYQEQRKAVEQLREQLQKLGIVGEPDAADGASGT